MPYLIGLKFDPVEKCSSNTDGNFFKDLDEIMKKKSIPLYSVEDATNENMKSSTTALARFWDYVFESLKSLSPIDGDSIGCYLNSLLLTDIAAYCPILMIYKFLHNSAIVTPVFQNYD